VYGGNREFLKNYLKIFLKVIDFEERKIDYFDSLKGDNFTCLGLLRSEFDLLKPSLYY